MRDDTDTTGPTGQGHPGPSNASPGPPMSSRKTAQKFDAGMAAFKALPIGGPRRRSHDAPRHISPESAAALVEGNPIFVVPIPDGNGGFRVLNTERIQRGRRCAEFRRDVRGRLAHPEPWGSVRDEDPKTMLLQYRALLIEKDAAAALPAMADAFRAAAEVAAALWMALDGDSRMLNDRIPLRPLQDEQADRYARLVQKLDDAWKARSGGAHYFFIWWCLPRLKWLIDKGLMEPAVEGGTLFHEDRASVDDFRALAKMLMLDEDTARALAAELMNLMNLRPDGGRPVDIPDDWLVQHAHGRGMGPGDLATLIHEHAALVPPGHPWPWRDKGRNKSRADIKKLLQRSWDNRVRRII